MAAFIRTFFVFSWLTIFWIPGTGHASAPSISLLEDQRDIQCEFSTPHPKFDRLLLDKKDLFINAYKGEKRVEDFERIKFLDSAMLLRSKKDSKTVALFHILLNGQLTYSEGQIFSLKESDCDDTGASKTCKTHEIKKFYWSPEKLELETGKQKVQLEIDQYGFLANNATYFRALNKETSSPSLTLLDYGAPLQILVGKVYVVSCKTL